MNCVLKIGDQHAARRARTSTTRTGPAGQQPARRPRGDLGGASGKGNRLNKYADYGGELGGPIVRDRLWGWGSYGRTDVNIQTLAGVPDKTKLDRRRGEDPGARSPQASARQLHLLQRQQAEGRPRRRPAQPAGDDVDPGRAVEDVQGGDRLRRVELAVPDRARRARQRPVHADPEGRARQRPGVHRQRRRVPQQQPVQLERSAAGRVQRRRQLVPRPARGPLRRLVPQLQGRPDRRATPATSSTSRSIADGTTHRDSDPSVSPGQSRHVHVALRRRHVLARPADAERRRCASIAPPARWTRSRCRRTRSCRTCCRASARRRSRTRSCGTRCRRASGWPTRSARTARPSRAPATRRSPASCTAPAAGNVSAASFAYAYYLAVDATTTSTSSRRELRGAAVREEHPARRSVKPVNRIAPDLQRAAHARSDLSASTASCSANFGVSAVYTWRRYVNQLWNQAPPIGATSADYVEDGRLTGNLPDGTAYDVPYFALQRERRAGRRRHADREPRRLPQTFNGIELAATKRLKNRWMGRFGFSWNRAREYFDDPSKSIVDPTPITADPRSTAASSPCRPPAAASRRST